MTTAYITNVHRNPSRTEGFNVQIAWRYCGVGGFMVVASGIPVYAAGNLINPYAITFDENICPGIEVRITEEDCGKTYRKVYPNGSITTTTTTLDATTSTTTTTTAAPTTTTTTVAPVTVYYGGKDTNGALTESGIEGGTSLSITPGSTIVVDFTGASGPKYLWMAEPVSEPLKTKWWGDEINNGNMGTDQDLFDAPVVVGGYRFYISLYPTMFTTVTEFRIS